MSLTFYRYPTRNFVSIITIIIIINMIRIAFYGILSNVSSYAQVGVAKAVGRLSSLLFNANNYFHWPGGLSPVRRFQIANVSIATYSKNHLLFIPVTTGFFAVDSTLIVELSKFNAASKDDDFLNTI